MNRIFLEGGELYKYVKNSNGEDIIFEAKTYQDVKSINELERKNR